MAQGKLEKMKIIAYNDPHCEDSHKVGDAFSALVNPETYSLDYKVVFNSSQGQGSSATQQRYSYTPPEEMSFDFLFDSTGLLGNASLLSKAIGKADAFLGTGGAIGGIATGLMGDKGVYEDVEKFKKMMMEYDSSSHEPKHFKLIWGRLIFKGRCTGLSINYKLFNPDGTPIRAMCKVTFKGSVEENLRVAIENALSPDLTHYRVVKEGDTLPGLCYRIYGDSKYYLEVAKVNKLVDFRNLRQGDELFFPPVEKVKK